MRYNRQQQQNSSNPFLYAIIGSMAALILAIGAFVAYKEISRQNDKEVANRQYIIRNMGTYELNKADSSDPLIQEERNRRTKEITDSLWSQYRD